jgi:hypothetical protein
VLIMQLKASEHIQDFTCAVVTVRFRVCKPVRLLKLSVVTFCKWSINSFINPKTHLTSHAQKPHVTI